MRKWLLAGMLCASVLLAAGDNKLTTADEIAKFDLAESGFAGLESLTYRAMENDGKPAKELRAAALGASLKALERVATATDKLLTNDSDTERCLLLAKYAADLAYWDLEASTQAAALDKLPDAVRTQALRTMVDLCKARVGVDQTLRDLRAARKGDH